MNRTKLLRSLVNLAGGDSRTIFIRGPKNSYGVEGEVSYVACYTNLSADKKQAVCDTIKKLDRQIERAYVTRRVVVARMAGRVFYRGGNIKVVYHTRANGKPV